MEKFKNALLLGIICVISFLVLSYKLSEIPNGIYVDEATTGYNAYSILKTGKDEYGKNYPIAFRFFGSYTPPLYTYLTVIPISLFGLNEFSIRIVSAISGTLMILVIHGFLKNTGLINQKIIPALLLLFIITPWNFFFSRIGYELYLGFSLFSLGVLFCLMGLKKQTLLVAGLTILSFSTYASHPQIYSVPIFILGFLGLFGKQVNKKFLAVGLISALIIQIPHISLLGTQAFLNKSGLFYSDEIISNAQKILFLPKVISLPLSFAFSFLARLLTYFSPYSLFFFSDPDPQRSIPEISVFYNWMVVPFLMGVFILIKNIKDNSYKFLTLLIVAAVVPTALTHDPFSTQRGLSLLLPLFLIICIGLSSISTKLGFKNFLVAFIAALLISLTLLWRSYFILLPSERAVAWNYGYKELAKFIEGNPDKQFLVEQIRGKPSYIELAFFLKLDPEVLQKSVDPEIKENYYNLNQFNPEYSFKNIQTKTIKWEEDIYEKQILVGDELVVSQTQAKEHFLTEAFVIKDPRDYRIIKGFLTDPARKCQETNNSSTLCLK